LVLAAGIRANGQSAAYAFTNFVGQSGVAGTNDGVGNAAQFDHPTGIAVDRSGNLFVADTWNNTIRRVTPEGVVTTIAGSPGNPGNADGLGVMALLNGPNALAVGGAGNLFIADGQNQTIRQLTPVGTTGS
jgi:sugar lactone lactonase YvrE